MAKSVASRQADATPFAKRKGKQPKRFLEKNDALELAASIAGLQEEKSLVRAEKHHNAQVGQPKEYAKPHISAARVKLKETKALLAAQRARTKKERAKRKRLPQEMFSNEGNEIGSSSVNPGKAARKSVSFA